MTPIGSIDRMKLRNEIQTFLDEHPNISGRALARAAGVPAPCIGRLLSGERKGMHSTNAEKVRTAMSRLRLSTPSAPIPTETTTPHTPRARAQ